MMGFATNKIISNVEARTQNCLAAALDTPGSLFICMCDGNILIKCMGEDITAFHTLDIVSRFNPDFTHAIMPGKIGDQAIVAVPGRFSPETLDSEWRVISTRSIMYSRNLPLEQAGAIGMATSLLHWHQTNQFCGKCGAPSRSQIGGMRRDCSQCKSQIFPRTDPAVIMLGVRGSKCLLGRGPDFPPNWYSCLAGFVEPGETIEQAVRRETFEESGIRIGRVEYFASQPWPFPHSLMIGAYCEALSAEVSFDGVELEDCRWFERDEVMAMMERRHRAELRLPPSQSIAAHIVGHWLEKTA